MRRPFGYTQQLETPDPGFLLAFVEIVSQIENHFYAGCLGRGVCSWTFRIYAAEFKSID